MVLRRPRPFGYTIGKGRTLLPNPKEQAAILLIQRLAKEEDQPAEDRAAVMTQYPDLKLSHTTVASVLRRHGLKPSGDV